MMNTSVFASISALHFYLFYFYFRPSAMDIDDDNKSKENQEASKESTMEKRTSKKDLVGIFFSCFGL